MIDSHVHCRDWKQSHKETIAHALSVAERVGLSGIFDMPNTDPPITSRELVEKRLADAKKANSPVFYGLYIGITSDPDQIREAVDLHRTHFPKQGDKVGVIGLKMFAGKSVGDLSVVDVEEQNDVYNTLAFAKYKGVLALHCEREDCIHPEYFNPKVLATHDRARPEISELGSISDQILFARGQGFAGHLHICHVSAPDSVNVIELVRDSVRERYAPAFFGRISCGVTPHHLLLDCYTAEDKEEAILYKVNPPLRNPLTREGLFVKCSMGEIDILETDHAPHTLDEKTGAMDSQGKPQYMSGIPGLASWPDFVRILIKQGGATKELINKMTHENVNRIFGTNIPELNLPIQEAPTGEYAFDAYKNLK